LLRNRATHSQWFPPLHGLFSSHWPPKCSPIRYGLVFPRGRLFIGRVNDNGDYDLHRQYGLNRRMPVWGPILGTLDHSSENRSLQTLRVSNLADYIQSLQAK